MAKTQQKIPVFLEKNVTPAISGPTEHALKVRKLFTTVVQTDTQNKTLILRIKNSGGFL